MHPESLKPCNCNDNTIAIPSFHFHAYFFISTARKMHITRQFLRERIDKDSHRRLTFQTLHCIPQFHLCGRVAPSFLPTPNPALPESCLRDLCEITTEPKLFRQDRASDVSLRVPLRPACHILNQPATARSKSAERAVKRDVTHILDPKR